MTSRWVPLVLAAVLASSACAVVRTFTGRTVTGTCTGACDHYLRCKPGSTQQDRTRCLAECPQVFSDRDSLGAYESLDCDDAVAFVDGDPEAQTYNGAHSSEATLGEDSQQ